VSLVEQELLTFPGHLSSPPGFSGVRVTRSLVLCVCFVDLCLSFYTVSFDRCVVCSSSIYGFWLPLWYLQSLREDTKWAIRSRISKKDRQYNAKNKGQIMIYKTLYRNLNKGNNNITKLRTILQRESQNS
jgi:hypothetical protein